MKAVLKSLYQNSRNKEIKNLIFNAFNKDHNIRNFAAYNINTPISILEKLSNDKDYSVRGYVAENINTPIPTLEKLSKDENGWVRHYVFINLNWTKKYE